MDVFQTLKDLGFDRVEILDGKVCGIAERRLILCFAFYEADAGCTGVREPVIHAYYPVSQQAYRAARSFVQHCAEQGLRIRQANEIQIKGILNRLPFLRRGRNTLSYLHGQGSRFHVQILAADEDLPVTAEPETKEHPICCGTCIKCMKACPGGAIREDGFEKERCLRFWMMSGKLPPAELAEKMGNRLIGCDDCEACCPMNQPGTMAPETVSLKALLEGNAEDNLADKIGRNYAIPNRLLVQGCLIAGSTGREDLRDRLMNLEAESASPAVRDAAAWALRTMEEQKHR